MAYTSGAHIFGKAMLLATALCGGVSGPALAETYEISGVYSETAFAPVLARRIAIGQFDGELGVQFSYIMARALADIYVNEERHFDMVAAGSGARSDAEHRHRSLARAVRLPPAPIGDTLPACRPSTCASTTCGPPSTPA